MIGGDECRGADKYSCSADSLLGNFLKYLTTTQGINAASASAYFSLAMGTYGSMTGVKALTKCLRCVPDKYLPSAGNDNGSNCRMYAEGKCLSSPGSTQCMPRPHTWHLPPFAGS